MFTALDTTTTASAPGLAWMASIAITTIVVFLLVDAVLLAPLRRFSIRLVADLSEKPCVFCNEFGPGDCGDRRCPGFWAVRTAPLYKRLRPRRIKP